MSETGQKEVSGIPGMANILGLSPGRSPSLNKSAKKNVPDGMSTIRNGINFFGTGEVLPSNLVGSIKPKEVEDDISILQFPSIPEANATLSTPNSRVTFTGSIIHDPEDDEIAESDSPQMTISEKGDEEELDSSVIRPRIIPNDVIPANSDPEPINTPRAIKNDLGQKGISILSNQIGNYLKKKEVYDNLGMRTKTNNFPSEFYSRAQNAVYNSLMEFLEIDHNVADGTDPIIPEVFEGDQYEETWEFLQKIADMSTDSDDLEEVIETYLDLTNCFYGIHPNWIGSLAGKFQKKLNLDRPYALTLAETIGSVLCFGYDENDDSEAENQMATLEDLGIDIEGVTEAYSDEEDDEEPFMDICVDTEPGVPEDIITIEPPAGHTLTLFCNLSTLDTSEHNADPMNGYWNWLKYFKPSAMFWTLTPEKFLRINDIVDTNKFVAIYQEEDSDRWMVGLYYVSDMIVLDGDTTFLRQLDMLCHLNLHGSPNLSHLDRTLNCIDILASEDEVNEIIAGFEEYLEETEQEVQTEEEPEPTTDTSFEEIAKAVSSDYHEPVSEREMDVPDSTSENDELRKQHEEEEEARRKEEEERLRQLTKEIQMDHDESFPFVPIRKPRTLDRDDPERDHDGRGRDR